MGFFRVHKKNKKTLFLVRLEFGWNYIQTKNPKSL